MAVYQPNFAGFQAMALGPELAAACRAEAERAKVIAEGLAQDFRVSGEYAESFVVTDEVVEMAGHLRVAGRLTNTAPYAAAVEWGNRDDRDAHRVLGRTLAALGNG